MKGLMSTRADEKATLSSLERKLAEERRQKTDFQIKLETERKVKKEAASAEKTAQQNQTRSEVAKLEAEMNTLRSELDRARDRCETAEREAYQLRSYKEVHGDPEVLVNALKGVQEKNRQLEIKLSEETKVKLDLFSALGEAKREIGIRESKFLTAILHRGLRNDFFFITFIFFSNFYLDFFFPFLFGLLSPFYFASPFCRLDFYFPFSL